MSLPDWICPRCKKVLVAQPSRFVCSACRSIYETCYGLPDFRTGFKESENQLLLAERFYQDWQKLSYEDMVRARFSNLRERGLAAGKNPEDFKVLDQDEAAHLRAYKSRGRLHSVMLKAMVEQMGGAVRVDRLVDIGCGWGRDLLHLSRLAECVIGVDVSTFSLLMTKKLCEEQGVMNVTLVLAQGEALPLPAAWAAGLNSSATIEHFPQPGEFLKEASRCLRSGGWLFLYYPNRFSLLPETHTGIWGLGWIPRSWQNRMMIKKRGRGFTWDVTLFSGADFGRLVKANFDAQATRITGIPPGLEEFAQTSKFADMLGPGFGLVRTGIKVARRVPGGQWLVSSIAPVHYAAIIRR